MNNSTILRSLALPAAIAATAIAQAGNVPQYNFNHSKSDFKFIEDGTVLNVNYGEAPRYFFADKRPYLTAHSGQGFPIGFNFRFGGREFNQFIINDNGYIMFGKDRVSYNGYSNLAFGDATRYGSDHFYCGLRPATFGIKKGEISYKLEGEEGSRTMTVQFAHMEINEKNIKGNAIYSLQIVLHEADNSVDINFLEEEAPYVSNHIMAGLAGWENSDRMLVQASAIGEPFHVAEGTVINTSTGENMTPWSSDDLLGETHDEPYSFRLRFVPDANQECTLAAPEELDVTQEEDTLQVRCKATDKAGTMILVSDQPFTDADMPEQGVSYQVMNDNGEYVTKIGNATLIYYGQDEEPYAELPKVAASKKYYVRALSVNGYPAYNPAGTDLEFITSHEAPSRMSAEGSDKEHIRINIDSFAQVMIAATNERVTTTDKGDTGIFGMPDADAQVGDEIEGGGKIVYVGDPGEIDIEANKNILTFYRAWTLNDGRLSATHTNTRGVTMPSIPYERPIENETLAVSPLNWFTSSNSTDGTVNSLFNPYMRGESGDEPAMLGISTNGSTCVLMTPELPLTSPTELNFEWALETLRPSQELDPSDGPAVQLPEGNIPGDFGLGHKFVVSAGIRSTENCLYEVNEYNGSLKANPSDPDHNISGTSSWIPVGPLSIPQIGEKGRVRFQFSTEGFSYMFLRNIRIGYLSSNEEIAVVPTDMVWGGNGSLQIMSAEGGEYDVYSVDGRRVAHAALNAGETVIIPLKAGIYIAGGEKVVVR